MYIVKFNNRKKNAYATLIDVAISYAEQIINEKRAEQAIIYKITSNGKLAPITHIDKI